MRKKKKWGRSCTAIFLLILSLCSVTAVSEAYAENGWWSWDEPENGMEQGIGLSGELAEKTAVWKARLESAAAARAGQMQPTEPQIGQQSEPQMGQQSEPQIGQQSEPQMGQQSEPQMGQQSEPQMEQSEPQIGQQSISEGDAQNMGSEYIFSDTDVRYLTREEVEKLSLQAACYAKNEIYARHGRMFRSQELQDYFGEKSWYVGSIPPDEFLETVFNDYEKANISSLQSWEYTLNGNGYLLDQAGYDIHSF